MADITNKTIKKLAKLANIGLTPSEVETMTKELGSIVGWVEQLQQADIDGLEPTYQVTGLQDAFRADEIKRDNPDREQLLANAPEQQDGYIKVPRVL